MKPTAFHDLIQLARSGDQPAVEQLMGSCRRWLRESAAVTINGKTDPSADLSDMVQESLLEAHRDLKSFRGTDEQEFVIWLKKILKHNLADRLKYETRQKRRNGHQRLLQDSGGNVQSLQQLLAAEQSSPSHAARRTERHQQLADAIDCLPKDQATVVRLRHLDGLSLTEIALRTKRTKPAIAGLLTRAVRRLRDLISLVDH